MIEWDLNTGSKTRIFGNDSSSLNSEGPNLNEIGYGYGHDGQITSLSFRPIYSSMISSNNKGRNEDDDDEVVVRDEDDEEENENDDDGGGISTRIRSRRSSRNTKEKEKEVKLNGHSEKEKEKEKKKDKESKGEINEEQQQEQGGEKDTKKDEEEKQTKEDIGVGEGEEDLDADGEMDADGEEFDEEALLAPIIAANNNNNNNVINGTTNANTTPSIKFTLNLSSSSTLNGGNKSLPKKVSKMNKIPIWGTTINENENDQLKASIKSDDVFMSTSIDGQVLIWDRRIKQSNVWRLPSSQGKGKNWCTAVSRRKTI